MGTLKYSSDSYIGGLWPRHSLIMHCIGVCVGGGGGEGGERP